VERVAARHGGDMRLSAIFSRRSGKNGTHPVDSYLDSLTPNTRKAYARALEAIAEAISGGKRDAHSLNWIKLDHTDDLRLKAAVQNGISKRTANLRLTVYRVFMQNLWEHEAITADRLLRVKTVKNLRRQSLPVGRELPAHEIDAAIDWCEAQPSPKGLRDAALIAMLYGTGMRRSEAVAFRLEDYRPGKSPEVVIRDGKGGKERGVDLKPALQTRIDAWIKVRGLVTGPLFCPVGTSGQVYIGKLHPQTITDIVREVAEGCGLAHFTPHDLRRSFCTHLLDAKNPITIVAGLMGHSDVKTTMGYYRSSQEKERKASYSLPGGGA
jgi:integrase/recombinase XerD